MRIIPSYCRRFEINPAQYPVVVFESDDWGACEVAPRSRQSQYQELLQKHTGKRARLLSSLETPEELDALFKVLQNYRGQDGIAPVFTAFTSMGNPDYQAIANADFKEYHDIFIGDGFPQFWGGDGVIEKMRTGQQMGIWEPEYHSMLHHTSPKLWLELLRGNGADAELARDLFELQCYNQLKHIPEYEGYHIREQFQFVNTGFTRFEKLFGRTPQAAVTSDAYPETEIIWAARGVRTVCIKNCRINSGEVVVYPTKPWNMQDVYARIGDYEAALDLVYLTRNVFMEQANTAEEVLQTIERNFSVFKEPCVISTHRSNYCSLSQAENEKNIARLQCVLGSLQKRGAIFLTTGELGDLYRQGWSCRRLGQEWLFRCWFAEAQKPTFASHLPLGNHRLPDLPEISETMHFS